MKIWRYGVPNEKGEGWAILFLDEAQCFAVLSDYGNYSHRWPAGARSEREPDIRHMLLTCDDHYLMGKLSKKVARDEGTAKAIKENIIEGRRHGSLNKDRAAFEWELAGDLAEGSLSFEEWCGHTRFQEPWEYRYMGYPTDVEMFFKKAWPRLKELIRAELAAEAKQVAAVSVR